MTRLKILAVLLGSLIAALTAAQAPQGESAASNAALQARMQKAAGLMQSGEVEAAAAELEAILAVAPKHGPANLMLGEIRLGRGDLEAARENLEIAASSNVRRPYLAWFLLGRSQLALGQFEAAQASFAETLARTPQFGPALLGRAQASMRTGAVEVAMEDLEAARGLQGTGPEATFLLAELLAFEERTDEAAALLGPLARTDGVSVEGTSARMLLLAMGAEEGRNLLYRLVGENLQLARSYLALGVACLRSGDSISAAKAFRVALEVDDQDPVPWLFLQRVSDDEALTAFPAPFPELSALLESAHQLQAAGASPESEVASILERRPFHAPARLLLVLEAEARDDPWSALAGYRQLVDWLPEVPLLQARAARVAHTMKAEELAECLARRAMRLMPEEASLHYLLAAIQSEAGDWEASSASCKRAIDLGMEEAPLYLTLGRVEFEQMHIGASIAAYARAVELDPDADRAVPRFALANLSTEEFDALRDLMQSELERDPNGENTLYTLGLMSLRESEFAAAVDYFEKLSELLPEDTQVQHQLGTAYMRAGDTDKGKAALERFRELKAKEEEAWVEHNQAYAKKLEAQDATAAGDSEQALRIYNELAALGFAEPDDYLAAGSLYLAAGDFERAYGWYEQFLGSNPYKREALEGLAEAAAGLGRADIAAPSRARADLLAWPCSVD